jgi:simple sugar transport system ATP-binding protein
MTAQPIISVRNATKEYHGVAVIKDVSFDLYSHEIHALLGENGAGKSTLSKIIAGVVEPTKGEITFNGKPIAFSGPHQALEAGIAMVFQETSLVPSLTVAQNLFLGSEKVFNRLSGLYIAAQQFLQSLKFQVDPTMNAGQLGAAQKQMVEIARAVLKKAKVIIFDEPTATLTPEEKQHFFSLVRRLKAEGTSIIFISHALEEALLISDRITVLRDGNHIVTDDTGKFDRDSIIRAMVGRTLTNEIYNQDRDARNIRPRGKRILSIENLSMGSMVKNNSFTVYSGQVTGIFGLVGSGRTETAKIIAGVIKRNFFHGGEILLEDRPVRFRLPRAAMKQGIVYVTEDRKIEGCFEQKSIAENITFGDLPANREALLVSFSRMRALVQKWTKRLNIKSVRSENAKAIELSGGNQQKVVIAKSLIQQPKLIIFDEPTRGVDVGAIAEIHQLINDLADQGLAVVVISSYLPEILNLSDRILVMRQGRTVEEFSPADVTEQRIMYASIH